MTDAGGTSAGAVPHVDLDRTIGYLVADVRGLVVGRVEAPRYTSSERTADALSVRTGALRRRRRLVPAGAIAAIDERTRVVGLRIERGAIRAFL
jgi:hypothetical protein